MRCVLVMKTTPLDHLSCKYHNGHSTEQLLFTFYTPSQYLCDLTVNYNPALNRAKIMTLQQISLYSAKEVAENPPRLGKQTSSLLSMASGLSGNGDSPDSSPLTSSPTGESCGTSWASVGLGWDEFSRDQEREREREREMLAELHA